MHTFKIHILIFNVYTCIWVYWSIFECIWIKRRKMADLLIVSLKINLFSPWYSWKMAELVLDNNHSLTQFVFCVMCLLSRINRFLLFCMGILDYFWRSLLLFYCIMILDTFWTNTEDYQTNTGWVCGVGINTPISMVYPWQREGVIVLECHGPSVNDNVFSLRIWRWWVAMLSWNHYTWLGV